LAVGEARLGGADVEAPVDLQGVGVDDLAGEPLGERHRQGALAGGGGADDGEDPHRSRSSTAVKSAGGGSSKRRRFSLRGWTKPSTAAWSIGREAGSRGPRQSRT